MFLRLVKAVLILPGTVAVLVPGLLLWASGETRWAPMPVAIGAPRFFAATLFVCLGLGLAVWTMSLFTSVGQGTPAPWDPPQKLVVRGPYGHVRNPMITGVLFLLTAEALAAGSWPIAIWMLLFFAGNSIYFPLVEEKGLAARFGEDYLRYKKNVPRWLPRLRPWTPEGA